MSGESGRTVVVGRDEAILKEVARTRGARMAVLIGPAHSAAGGFITRRFVLAPGGKIPAHRHADIEHEQVVVCGEMVLTLDGEARTVRPGDAVLIPAGCAHAYENHGTAEVEFLCIVPHTSGYATEWLEDPPPGAFPG